MSDGQIRPFFLQNRPEDLPTRQRPHGERETGSQSMIAMPADFPKCPANAALRCRTIEEVFKRGVALWPLSMRMRISIPTKSPRRPWKPSETSTTLACSAMARPTACLQRRIARPSRTSSCTPLQPLRTPSPPSTTSSRSSAKRTPSSSASPPCSRTSRTPLPSYSALSSWAFAASSCIPTRRR